MGVSKTKYERELYIFNFLYLQLELTIELIDIEGSRREILKPFLKIAIFERYVLYRPQNRNLTP